MAGGRMALEAGAAQAARRRRNLERWRRRSRLIHFYRRALPATMAAILICLAGWVLARGLLTRLGDVRNAIGTIHMSNARFFGRDQDGRPYVMAAAEAIRYDNDLQRIILRKPAFSFDSGGKSASQVNADWGVYRDDNKLLHIWTHVVMVDSSGDVFHTDQAVVDTVNDTVNGPAHVDGEGPTGSVSADSFAVYDKGGLVVFRGHVHSERKAR